MFDGLTFDELNELNTTYKAIPFDRYFDEMGISREQKRERRELAEKFEDRLIFVLAFVFTMVQYMDGNIDWYYVQTQFELAYRQALNAAGIPIDSYLDLAAREFAEDVTQSTRDNMEDPYYYTDDRAGFMAEDQAAGVEDYVDFANALNSGKTMKEWCDMKDNRERETHRRVGGMKIPINDLFRVGDSLMRFPKDLEFSPSPEETINCRCWAEYT